jgi:hypothetical protein
LKNNTDTQVERFNVQGLPAFGGAVGDQGSGLMNSNSLNPKKLHFNKGGKSFSSNG